MEPERRIAELEAELTAKDARIAAQDERIAAQATQNAEQQAQLEALQRQVAELTERLGRNSGNSNQPPSSDSPKARAERKGKSGKGKRRRGGQPGHRGSRRTLLAAEHVDDVVNMYPDHCEHCSQALPQTPDPHAKRYQHTELPAFEPHTTEFRVLPAEMLDATRGAVHRQGYVVWNRSQPWPDASRGACDVRDLTMSLHMKRRRGARG